MRAQRNAVLIACVVVGAATLPLVAWTGRSSAGEVPGAVLTPDQIEADWLRQDVVRKLPPAAPYQAPPALSTRDDAAGAVDGLKDGTYGFHTGQDANPWWQVDLGEPMPLDRVVIYNRCDGNVEARAARIAVLLSDDGNEWSELYRHEGYRFGGQTDGKPLSVPARGKLARFVRLALPGPQYLHLDEVEVYRVGDAANVALNRPADQSSTSPWSRRPVRVEPETVDDGEPAYPIGEVVRRGLALAEDLRRHGADVDEHEAIVGRVAEALGTLTEDAPAAVRRDLYLRARWAVRRMALANPLLDFDDLLFVKRVPGSFTHMSDQYYGWFSRPGGGVYVLEDFKSEAPRLRCLTHGFAPGSFLRPDLSYDGTKVLFAYAKHYPGLKDEPDKLNKENVPEDAFYHLYEMRLDGTGLRRLTRGKYDDFDGRYLPDGDVVFLSTRRGQHLQCGQASGQRSRDGQLPDSYVRCGGGPERPVAVYTLHTMDCEGNRLRQISAFEMFEWTPSIAADGRILYARWDYVDRHNMPYMSLWSTLPDGTGARAVFGNYTVNPHCVFEVRAIPRSQKLIFTASGHHAFTGGSLVLLDPGCAFDGEAAMTRLTPEVAFPESEGWPQTYFTSPYPLSEEHYLTAWSAAPLPPGTPRPHWGMPGPPNDLGLYLFDAFGSLELLYRDREISSECPLPIRSRPKPPTVSSLVDWEATDQEGRMLLVNVYEGLESVPRGTIRRLRLVGIPVKTHPTMNYPSMGLTRDDPGKVVLGTVPVEDDGSAYFHVPAGVNFFLQALDDKGTAVQTMRSAVYVQPGQTFTCVGCHEPRNTSPPAHVAVAMGRAPSKIAPAPEGSWPLDFATLVGPVLDARCVACHKPGPEGAKPDLSPAKAYDSLVDYGSPSLREHVLARYTQGRSIPGAGAAQTSPLVALLRQGHYEVDLSVDDWERLFTWLDTYGQRRGSFSDDQEQRLRDLRHRMAGLLAR